MVFIALVRGFLKSKAVQKSLTIIMLFLTASAFVFADSGVSLNIRYFDRRIHYLEGDPILVLFTVSNDTPAPFRFRLAEERSFSVDFDVRTSANRAVEAAPILLRRRSQSQQVFFREITLETGESFSFVEDLRDYAALNQSGAYVVQARLFPELSQPSPVGISQGISPGGNLAAQGHPLESNRLTLSIRPSSLIGPDNIPLELDRETNADLVKERLPPDEVVTYFITARQRSHWERYFLYLDLEALLTKNAERRRQWNAESAEGRRHMLARYRQDLQNSLVDRDISEIPTTFTIERTVHDGREGTVSVLKHFRIDNYTERKRYTYYLERRDEFWIIIDYSVVNLGTM
jgi:hypothetical protein